jgi:phosphocarrier protein FPr
MIEVPAAAVVSHALAAHADFFSIGTNDLTQYALAIDRQNPELASEADSLHPAVLRLIAMTVEGARSTTAGSACAAALRAIPLARRCWRGWA